MCCRVVAVEDALRAEFAKHTLLQTIGLFLDPVVACWPLEGLTAHDVLMRAELASGQVNLGPVWEPVPPVIVDTHAINVNLTAHELPAQEAMHHNDGRDALSPSWVLGCPVRSVLRCTGFRIPSPRQRPLELPDRRSSLWTVHRVNIDTAGPRKPDSLRIRAGPTGESYAVDESK